jgi:hypothetical protein
VGLPVWQEKRLQASCTITLANSTLASCLPRMNFNISIILNFRRGGRVPIP